ncbi:MAG: tetratricopeptide repeat protein [Gemmatimonadaceae bacterium]
MNRSANRCLTLAVVLAASIALAPREAHAQQYIARADSLMRRGRVFAAETLYYYAVHRTPRDPAARLALGRFLAARGALRIGAVLMEEARFFGGDPKTVGTYLAPVYARLGDYKALSALPGSPLPYAQRARAEWLADNQPSIAGPDSAVVVLLPADSGSLGVIDLVIGGDSVQASIDPRVQGMSLDTAWLHRKSVKRFASTFDNDWRNLSGVALSVGVGPFTLTNVPTSFAPTGDAARARVGLDFIAQLAPTLDPIGHTMLLRKSGRIENSTPGERIPTLSYPGGLWLIQRDGIWPLGGTNASTTIGTRPFTLNARKGELILDAR